MSSIWSEAPSGSSEKPPPQPPPGSDQPKGAPPGDMHDRKLATPLKRARRRDYAVPAGPPLPSRVPLFAASWSQCGRAVRTR